MLMLKLLILGLALLIFAEDWKSRAVHWYLFPLMALALILLRFCREHSISFIKDQALYSFLFIVFQLLTISLYFSVKHWKLVNITKGLLGWGDVLFLLTLTLYFSPVNFLFFNVLSLMMVIIFWVVLNAVRSAATAPIPMAGLQAIFFAAAFLIEWVHPVLDLQQDDWIIKYLPL